MGSVGRSATRARCHRLSWNPSVLEKKVTTALYTTMSKKKTEHDTASDEPVGKTNTKVSVTMLRKARTVASHRDVDLFDYLDSILNPAVDRDYEALSAAIANESSR